MPSSSRTASAGRVASAASRSARRGTATGVALAAVLAVVAARPAAAIEQRARGEAVGATEPRARGVSVAQALPAEMVHVPAGVFAMGLDEAEFSELLSSCAAELGPELGTKICREKAAEMLQILGYRESPAPRRVFVSAFAIDRHEVTTFAYRACVAAGACGAGPLIVGDTRYLRDEWPLVNVTWHEAASYCAFRGKRLPTEAEWEKAARGTDGRRWPWGSRDRDASANLGRAEKEVLQAPYVGAHNLVPDPDDGAELLAPPGRYVFGRSVYGMEDAAGNVAEWVADAYDPDGLPLVPLDPRGADGDVPRPRVVRGGSFLQPRFYGRTYFRDYRSPGTRAVDRGFRCARDLPRRAAASAASASPPRRDARPPR